MNNNKSLPRRAFKCSKKKKKIKKVPRENTNTSVHLVQRRLKMNSQKDYSFYIEQQGRATTVKSGRYDTYTV